MEGMLEKKIVAALLIASLGVLFLGGCTEEEARECTTAADCGVGGCSGQICTTKDKAASIITTCEWRQEYGCYKLTSCGCVDGVCEWKENSEFLACLNNFT
jgi:eight-cysteine-cluster-containing protein